MPNGLESCAVKWPSPAEREQYKQWVEDMSCAEWRDRWYMIDGTLVSIFARPHYYGDIFFDRKSNYSFVQNSLELHYRQDHDALYNVGLSQTLYSIA
ncbi:hypothetical protein V1522DRAFT_64322 [Lipomyces starkeyi]